MMLAATGLMACSSDDKNDLKEEPRPMIVDVLGTTRAGDPTTTATLSNFSMNYQDNKYNFTKTDETWSTNTWPGGVGNDQKIDFYAYTGGTFNYNSGNPYVSFTVQETVANQHDLLVAEHKQISYNDAGGHVSLLFDHACAAVRFTVQISNTLHTNLGADLTVNSIVLKNVNSNGKYHYSSKSWTDQSGSRPYTLTNAAITVTTTPQQLSSNYLYMIPQTRAADGTTGTYLEISYERNGTKTATIPLNIDWKAGESYPINIKLGTTLIN
jgi:hypothetical protein